ncbi:MAG: hydroxymethylbilane synthase [Pseudomonadota bacterium]
MERLAIGTRKSKMAMAQTHDIIRRIEAAWPEVKIDVADMETRGDQDQESKLLKHGGKGGAFVESIRDGLRDGTIRLAMHSLKDVPGNEETPGVVIGAYLPRDGAEDALVVRPDHDVQDFLKSDGQGYKVGTNSVRRAAQLKLLYPALEVLHYRGAADTRVHKLDNQIGQNLPGGGQTAPADVLIMAKSGLERVSLADRIAHVYSVDDILPAATQGIVAVECPAQDWRAREILAKINDAAAECAALAEREVLWVLDGHCNSPMAAHAKIAGETLDIRAQVFSLDGARVVEASTRGDASKPREVGRELGLTLLEKGAGALIKESRE